jgi:hypothetical protein
MHGRSFLLNKKCTHFGSIWANGYLNQQQYKAITLRMLHIKNGTMFTVKWLCTYINKT